MSVPYTPALATKILRAMPDHRLATVTPTDFRRWPAQRPLPDEIGRELIDAERAMRRQTKRASEPAQGALL